MSERLDTTGPVFGGGRSSAFTVILTAGYILWTIQRVYLGPEYKGPHGDHLHPITAREVAIAAPLLAFAILFGVYPQALLKYITPTVDSQAQALADWTKTVKETETSATADAAPRGQDRTVQPLSMLQASR